MRLSGCGVWSAGLNLEVELGSDLLQRTHDIDVGELSDLPFDALRVRAHDVLDVLERRGSQHVEHGLPQLG